MWKKQLNEPLFPEIIWSRPENRMSAGKLLIIGGNKFAIAAPVNANKYSFDAGAGSARVLMPEATHKAFGKIISEGYFAPSNFSGSFAKNALAEWT
nr:hypothetical protein [bacterium]